VLNIADEHVGHIPKEVASQLAPKMDQLQDSLRVEGFIPTGSGNVYTIPMELSLYGPAAHRAAVGQMMSGLARYGVKVTVHNPQMEEPRPKSKGRASKKLAPTASEIIERQLEDIYATSTKYEDMAEAPTPPALTSALFLHQRKALQWMQAAEARGNVERELATIPDPAVRAQSNVFFWQKQPNGQYLNTATQSAVRSPPQLARGGILADDMGLGKTLTCLALVASDRVPTPTLIVCPLSVVGNWEEQLRAHCDTAAVTSYTCHGPGRNVSPPFPIFIDTPHCKLPTVYLTYPYLAGMGSM
jgi:SWI/SNF-related matrix-associated actin-dependent regulator of chromatin subfamily A3